MAGHGGRPVHSWPVHGWIVLDKPLGLTSTQAVGRLRRLFDAAKAGHAGTLDPLATGVLPVALGEATKTVPFAMDGEKSYRFTARWGEERSTDDAAGEVTATAAARPDRAEILAALPRFTGEIVQRPPAFSAIKVAGRRAYDLARAGDVPDLAARFVRIDALRLLDLPDADHAVFEMVCGKGAYVRALVRDLGRALGCLGHVAALRRLRVGPFAEARAISLEQIEALRDSAALVHHLLPVQTALDDIPALAVTGTEAVRLKRGQSIRVPERVLALADRTICAMSRGQPVALGRISAGELHPVRVFNLPLRGLSDVDHA